MIQIILNFPICRKLKNRLIQQINFLGKRHQFRLKITFNNWLMQENLPKKRLKKQAFLHLQYGFEWDGVLFSGEGLDEYKGYLDQIKSITKELDDGREKSRLQKLIAGWDEEYAKYQNDLSLLTDDQIVKIKFEYDMSTIQQKIDELDEQWKSGNRSAEIGAGRIAAQKMYRDKKEEKYGYTAGFDEKYGKLNEQIKLIESSFNDDMTEKQREQETQR